MAKKNTKKKKITYKEAKKLVEELDGILYEGFYNRIGKEYGHTDKVSLKDLIDAVDQTNFLLYLLLTNQKLPTIQELLKTPKED